MIPGIRLAWASGPDLPPGDDWLSAREQEVLRAITVPKRALDFRLGRWAARRVARQLFMDGELEVVAADDGAPELRVSGSPVPHVLSLSHSHGVAMAALGEEGVQVGCDLERVEPRTAGFLETFLTPAESAFVQAAPADRQALLANAIWSGKEAVLKATRDGLRRDTRSVEIQLHMPPEPRTAPRCVGCEDWYAYDAWLDGQAYDGSWRERNGWVEVVARG